MISGETWFRAHACFLHAAFRSRLANDHRKCPKCSTKRTRSSFAFSNPNRAIPGHAPIDDGHSPICASACGRPTATRVSFCSPSRTDRKTRALSPISSRWATRSVQHASELRQSDSVADLLRREQFPERHCPDSGRSVLADSAEPEDPLAGIDRDQADFLEVGSPFSVAALSFRNNCSSGCCKMGCRSVAFAFKRHPRQIQIRRNAQPSTTTRSKLGPKNDRSRSTRVRPMSCEGNSESGRGIEERSDCGSGFVDQEIMN